MDTCVLSYSPSQTSVEGKSDGRVRHTNELHRRLSCYPSTALSDLIPVATAALKASSEAEEDVTENTTRTSFARALTKVKLQIQSRRLKEKYLGHEWIRLALGLPVDEKIINSNKPRGDQLVVVKKCLEGRTGEIATWYEWKFDKSKFTVEEVENKVDRLRKKRIQIQQQQQDQQQQQKLAAAR